MQPCKDQSVEGRASRASKGDEVSATKAFGEL